MLSFSPIERVKPLLGTFVCVRVGGLAPPRASEAVDAAFAEIARIHALMSFHDEASDVSRLNRVGHLDPVAVDERTYDVLVAAQSIAEISGGAFDITIAPKLVTWGCLPRPSADTDADPRAIWRDVELLGDNMVRFRRPLWIDLGGIAKGYAVDRAIDRILSFGPAQAIVNAGGDLRVAGGGIERICLAPETEITDCMPIVEMKNGALASSSGIMAGPRTGVTSARHVDTLRGRYVSARQFVSVTAPRCIHADALTKVVMARGACAAPVLARFGAKAVVHDANFGWRSIGEPH